MNDIPTMGRTSYPGQDTFHKTWCWQTADSLERGDQVMTTTGVETITNIVPVGDIRQGTDRLHIQLDDGSSMNPHPEEAVLTTGLSAQSNWVRDQFQQRFHTLSQSLPGFDQLISQVQATLVAESLDTAEIPSTTTVEDTLDLARRAVKELAEMTEAWGVQR